MAEHRAADEDPAEALGQMVERIDCVERDQHRMLEREVGRREQPHRQHEQEHRQVHVVDRRHDGGEAEPERGEPAAGHEGDGPERGQ